jgi:YD repeat-containing protein
MTHAKHVAPIQVCAADADLLSMKGANSRTNSAGKVGMNQLAAVLLSSVFLLSFITFTEARSYSPRTTTYHSKSGAYMGKTVAQGNAAKTYNRSGKMVSRSVRQGNTTNTYSRSGQMVGKTVKQGNSVRTYNRKGQLTSNTVQQGNTVTTRDKTGRLVAKTTFNKR